MLKNITFSYKGELNMGKKVLVIATSPRYGSNSEMLADAWMKGAIEAGHEVEKVRLADKKISFCIGCMACHKSNRCVIQDDAAMIVQKMAQVDVIVFATPIYFYEMSGQMKTLIDRSNAIYTAKCRFKDVYLLATSAEAEQNAMDGAIKGVQGFIDCFKNARLAGVIAATGVTKVKEISDSDYLKQAYEQGKALV